MLRNATKLRASPRALSFVRGSSRNATAILRSHVGRSFSQSNSTPTEKTEQEAPNYLSIPFRLEPQDAIDALLQLQERKFWPLLTHQSYKAQPVLLPFYGAQIKLVDCEFIAEGGESRDREVYSPLQKLFKKDTYIEWFELPPIRLIDARYDCSFHPDLLVYAGDYLPNTNGDSGPASISSSASSSSSSSSSSSASSSSSSSSSSSASSAITRRKKFDRMGVQAAKGHSAFKLEKLSDHLRQGRPMYEFTMSQEEAKELIEKRLYYMEMKRATSQLTKSVEATQWDMVRVKSVRFKVEVMKMHEVFMPTYIVSYWFWRRHMAFVSGWDGTTMGRGHTSSAKIALAGAFTHTVLDWLHSPALLPSVSYETLEAGLVAGLAVPLLETMSPLYQRWQKRMNKKTAEAVEVRDVEGVITSAGTEHFDYSYLRIQEAQLQQKLAQETAKMKRKRQTKLLLHQMEFFLWRLEFYVRRMFRGKKAKDEEEEEEYMRHQQAQKNKPTGQQLVRIRKAYETLGFYTERQQNDALMKDIKLAFRKLAMQHHPDTKNTDIEKEEATEKMKELTQAYHELRRFKGVQI